MITSSMKQARMIIGYGAKTATIERIIGARRTKQLLSNKQYRQWYKHRNFARRQWDKHLNFARMYGASTSFGKSVIRGLSADMILLDNINITGTVTGRFSCKP